MSRSAWKGIYTKNFKLKKKIQIWNRASTITENFLSKSVFVHTGKDFKKIFINKEKIGFKFGEFCFTRKKKHIIDNKKKTK